MLITKHKHLFWFLCLFIFLFIFPSKTLAQVVINEISSKGSSDWVELYVLETTDMTGWILDDDDTVTDLEEFTQTYPAGTFFSIDVGNRLNDEGDIVSLYSASNSVINQIPYGNKGGVCFPNTNQSVGRVDNGNTIERFVSTSKSLTNEGVRLDPCPTPTPSPSPQPTEEAAPSPSPTPTKTPSPVPTATKKPTTKPSATPTQEGEEEEIVLGESFMDSQPSFTPEGLVEGTFTTPFPYQAVGLIVSGLGFMGYGAFSVYKKNKKGLEVVTD